MWSSSIRRFLQKPAFSTWIFIAWKIANNPFYVNTVACSVLTDRHDPAKVLYSLGRWRDNDAITSQLYTLDQASNSHQVNEIAVPYKNAYRIPIADFLRVVQESLGYSPLLSILRGRNQHSWTAVRGLMWGNCGPRFRGFTVDEGGTGFCFSTSLGAE